MARTAPRPAARTSARAQHVSRTPRRHDVRQRCAQTLVGMDAPHRGPLPPSFPVCLGTARYESCGTQRAPSRQHGGQLRQLVRRGRGVGFGILAAAHPRGAPVGACCHPPRRRTWRGSAGAVRRRWLSMETVEDFEDILELFAHHQVRYLICRRTDLHLPRKATLHQRHRPLGGPRTRKCGTGEPRFRRVWQPRNTGG